MTGTGTAAPRVRDLSASDFDKRLQAGLGIRLGPFDACLHVHDPAITCALQTLYADYQLLPHDSVFSFHVRLDAVRPWLPWRGARVRFSVDGRRPHEDMPAEHALAVLEWGINLVVAMRSHHFLMLHSAVVAKGDQVLLLPAAPGAGKTTLCAALMLAGWRLFSDEFGLMHPADTRFVPAPRPLALKNQSIDVIRAFSKAAKLGPEITGTRKGTVAHLKPLAASIRDSARAGRARWIVYPQWQAGASCEFQPVPPGQSFMLLATNAFNYEVQGEAGFDSVARIVDSVESYRLVYSDLDEAVAVIERLVEAERE